MIKFFYKLFNHDKIAALEKSVDVYRERCEQLEEEVIEYKNYKLKYEVTKLYVDDDEAIDELLDCYQKKQNQEEEELRRQQAIFSGLAAQQNVFANAQAGGFNRGLLGSWF